ncbi:hypothetical protein [Paraburkholderia bryophila]|uniref:Phage integrase family protein n=1 Tax=Paraburkholderia bryophila TaxID=420952 RepID=A0A7Z0B2D4_9BURK|nr:hypothetical protein [Paraburkholderia bryophila]NYH18876.1 hypothetical protein [Paraburkholderia bryophila]
MYEITVIWPEGRTGKYGPTFRDATGKLIAPLTDYVQSKAVELFEQERSSTAYRSQMDSMVNTLTHFAEYLLARGVDWECVQSPVSDNENDQQTLRDVSVRASESGTNQQSVFHWLDVNHGFFIQFRDFELKRVVANPISKGDKEKSRDTVNRKLIHLYMFYAWAQYTACYARSLLGWGRTCQIRSRLSGDSPDSETVSFAEKYPACFPTPSAGNSSAYEQHWATSDDVRDLATYFDEHCSPLVAERNILLLKLGQHLAWRAGSVSSLTVDQFSDREIARQSRHRKDDFLVTPPTQKNGHQFAFRVPWSLVFHINSYIHDGVSNDSSGVAASGLTTDGLSRPQGGRSKLITNSGKSPRNAQGKIFLSKKDATPLSPHSIVNLFAKAFKAVGAPKGSGYHSVRRGSADEFGDETIEKRRRLGIPISREDFEQDMMELLGHSARTSHHAYIRSTQRTLRQTTEQRQHDELVEFSMENMQLKSKLAYQEESLIKVAGKRKRARDIR